MIEELMPIFMFATICLLLLIGYPVAITLASTALLFAGIGTLNDTFDSAFLQAFPNRLYGIMRNDTLIAVPLFVFMGVMLEKAKIAENLLETMAQLFGNIRGGLGISVAIVGMLLAASTGIVGATVVTMGLLSLPTLMKQKYDPRISTGIICASGTLGQIIPPSIVLVLLGEVISSAYQQAQLDMGNFTPKTISVGDLFVGALIPGLLLVCLYILYLIFISMIKPQMMPLPDNTSADNNAINYRLILKALFPPLFLILAVLGSILAGLATPTEAASVGAVGATVLAMTNKTLSFSQLKEVIQNTTQVTSMVFLILIGASIFSLVFRGFSGDEMIQDFLSDLPGGKMGAVFIVMMVMFLLGFILDFIEITFVIVPIVGPVLLGMGIDPVWLGIMIAINLQTSFLTPPFGFSLFYLRGVAPESISTKQIYQGVMPFIAIQIFMLILLAYWPSLATWIPSIVYG